jgi:Domain of unknown function (DUF397)
MQIVSAPWRKSSYSGNGGQDCVEAASDSGVVLIRDTKARGHGPVLRVGLAAFAAFTRRIREDAVL